MVKPSEVTPRFIGPLMDTVAAVPALAGALALVEGDGETGAALVAASDFIAFTGSVATGRRVAAAAAAAMIPASLELGGKDPLIVLASADAVAAARVALSASCRATGQACQSIERVYVAAPLMDAFLAALLPMAATVRPNAPDIGSGDLGPFIFGPQAAIVEAHLADAVAKGATIRTGGRIEAVGGGRWLMPTVVTGVTHAMALMREETFGPVIPVMPFETEDEAVALANDSDFGLSAAVMAGTVAEAAAVAVRLDAGAVSLNDGALTALVSDAEKSSFGLSGLGPSRAGSAGLLRFVRRRVLYAQEGSPLPLRAFSEA
jgi:acyl-CoA reductase-like NAD-dependent aldehyde dehydrogenase